MNLDVQEDSRLAHANSKNNQLIKTVEWEMMNKTKFFPLSMLSSFSVRCILYPFTVIKTRIQIQKHSNIYHGTFDAFRKILNQEGVSALYKGFWVSAFQVVSGISYITTYETVRHILHKNQLIEDSRVKALIGGGCASLVGQTIIVPFDVISQHMMVLGMSKGKGEIVNPLKVQFLNRSKLSIVNSIVKEVYKKDGLIGFYRGYLASIFAYVPNSALWWSFYHFYQDYLETLMPIGTSSLLIQCAAAPLGGATTTLLTNPLDIIRARLQIERSGSFNKTFASLWQEEQFAILTKGLSPRLIQSVIFSCMIIFGYESVKRLSVSEEYRPFVTW